MTNSCGDVTTLKLPVRMQMNTSGSFAEIKLSEYLAYRKVGEAVDPAAFVVSASAGGQEYGVGGVQINSNLDTSMPGVYTVTYTLSVEGNSTSTDLIIVVEE